MQNVLFKDVVRGVEVVDDIRRGRGSVQVVRHYKVKVFFVPAEELDEVNKLFLGWMKEMVGEKPRIRELAWRIAQASFEFTTRILGILWPNLFSRCYRIFIPPSFFLWLCVAFWHVA